MVRHNVPALRRKHQDEQTSESVYMMIFFFIDELPKSENKTRRSNHWQQTDEKKRWRFLVNAASRDPHGNIPHAPEPCEIVMTFFVMRQMDNDNAMARCKVPLDALRYCGIITDDNPKVVAKLTASQNIVRHRNEQGVLIEFFPVGEL